MSQVSKIMKESEMDQLKGTAEQSGLRNKGEVGIVRKVLGSVRKDSGQKKPNDSATTHQHLGLPLSSYYGGFTVDRKTQHTGGGGQLQIQTILGNWSR